MAIRLSKAESSQAVAFIERRGKERRAVDWQALGIANDQDHFINCRVRDVSARGARVSLTRFVIAPDQFKLYVPTLEKVYWCEVVWQRGFEVGVEFARAMPVPSGAGG